MKKISVKNVNLNDIEQLSRAELQAISGGDDPIIPGHGGSGCSVSCESTGTSCVTIDCKPGSCLYSNRVIVCVAY